MLSELQPELHRSKARARSRCLQLLFINFSHEQKERNREKRESARKLYAQILIHKPAEERARARVCVCMRARTGANPRLIFSQSSVSGRARALNFKVGPECNLVIQREIAIGRRAQTNPNNPCRARRASPYLPQDYTGFQ